jgi:hypothetical protein
MIKQLTYIFIAAVLLASCSTSRKAQVIQDALSKKDASSNQINDEKNKVDSGVLVQEIFDKIASNKLNYTTLNAKLKVDYETVDKSDVLVANVSIDKGNAIHIILKGAMGVIGLRALINKDSVILYYPLNKKLEIRPFAYLQEIVKIPLTYSMLEDLIVGNPIFLENASITNYKTNNDKLQIGLAGKLFKNLVSLSEDNAKVLHLKLDDIDINQHRTCDITYYNHTPALQYQFPLNRDIAVTSEARFEIRLEVKEYAFNEPLKYTFVMPKQAKTKTKRK